MKYLILLLLFISCSKPIIDTGYVINGEIIDYSINNHIISVNYTVTSNIDCNADIWFNLYFEMYPDYSIRKDMDNQIIKKGLNKFVFRRNLIDTLSVIGRLQTTLKSVKLCDIVIH